MRHDSGAIKREEKITMKFLLSTTAVLATAALPAFAQDTQTQGGQMFMSGPSETSLMASDLNGMNVYRSDEAVQDTGIDGMQDSWEDVGEIHDVIISRDGQVEAVLIDMGGFLGMGEHRVAMSMDALSFASDESTEDPGDFFVVVTADNASMQDAPAYDQGDQTGAATGTSGMPATTTGGDSGNAANLQENEAEQVGNEPTTSDTERPVETTTPTQDMPASGEDQMATDNTEGTSQYNPQTGVTPGTGATARDMRAMPEGYAEAPMEDLTAEMLTGATVYGPGDESLGDVSEILLSDDGSVDAVIVDVGGFLGIGAKPVELNLSDIQILRQSNGGAVIVSVPMTEEELEAMPEYTD
ncbi:PRC-barrel domain-containing protein [Salipiger marinus]|uniref:PRC-barrel domain-containing protein n=2 Tax=Salipiger marinus TaxID=555512 RepID=A0A1G8K3G7_9RHOB|nr:PRC-barrel domain-containing protein [Salipiger marinus]